MPGYEMQINGLNGNQIVKINFVDPKSCFPSFQDNSIIFHKGNFLKLMGVVLPHPSLS